MEYDDDNLPIFEPIRTTEVFRGSRHKRFLQTREIRSKNRGCLKKMQYSKKEALAARKESMARSGLKYIGIYKCPTCHCYHLTSKPPRKHNRNIVI